MDDILKAKVLDYLSGFITDNKKQKMDRVLQERTRHITVVVEDIRNAHNASAVLRSCECLGIQDVHVIENEHVYEVNPCVTQGSADWVDLHRYGQSGHFSTPDCYEALRDMGYCIVATTLERSNTTLDELPIDRKLAIVFGEEESGLTEYAQDNADLRMRIPMSGFTQSFNISVSAAITIYSLTSRLRSSDVVWHLNESEVLDLKYRWSRRIVNRGDLLEKKFLEELGSAE